MVIAVWVGMCMASTSMVGTEAYTAIVIEFGTTFAPASLLDDAQVAWRNLIYIILLHLNADVYR